MQISDAEEIMAISAVPTYLNPEEYITLERKAKPDAYTVRNEKKTQKNTKSAAPAVRNVYRNVNTTRNQAPAVRKVYRKHLQTNTRKLS